MLHTGGKPDRARGAAVMVGLALLFAAGYELYAHLGRLAFFAAPSARVPTPVLLALAVLGAAASFSSPCSIALTPAFLTYFVPGAAGDRRRLVRRSAFVAPGMLGFYAVAGQLVGTIGAVVYNVLTCFVPVVGLLFLGLGYVVVTDQGARLFAGPFRWRSQAATADQAAAPLVSGRREWDLLAFGAASGAASHTCRLPIFLGIVLVPLAVGNVLLSYADHAPVRRRPGGSRRHNGDPGAVCPSAATPCVGFEAAAGDRRAVSAHRPVLTVLLCPEFRRRAVNAENVGGRQRPSWVQPTNLRPGRRRAEVCHERSPARHAAMRACSGRRRDGGTRRRGGRLGLAESGRRKHGRRRSRRDAGCQHRRGPARLSVSLPSGGGHHSRGARRGHSSDRQPRRLWVDDRVRGTRGVGRQRGRHRAGRADRGGHVRASHPGRYRFHCASDMAWGTIVATGAAGRT